MEFILISESELKITLSQKELDIYNIDSEKFSIGNDAQRHAFRKVLNDACRQSGFDGNSSRLMIQMYPVKRGGCEIFVTRLEIGEEKKKERQPTYKKKKDEKESETCFIFSDFRQLSAVCKQLFLQDYKEKSSLYVSEDFIYYLILEGIEKEEKGYSPFSFIHEFSKSTSQTPICYLAEYCKPVCEENAVEIIGKL